MVGILIILKGIFMIFILTVGKQFFFIEEVFFNLVQIVEETLNFMAKIFNAKPEFNIGFM